MFDYNLLGIGLKYGDIRNVCSSLSQDAAEAFVVEYGGISEAEKTLDEVTSVLVDLITAFRRQVLPKWVRESIAALHNGQLEQAVRKIIAKR